MMPSPAIYHRSNARHFLLVLSRHCPSSRRYAGFTSRRPTNPIPLRADRSFTPTHTTMLRRKPIAETASVYEPRAGICG